MRSDRAIGGAILLLSLVMLYVAAGIDVLPGSGAVNARTLPMALCVIIGAGSLLLMIRPSATGLEITLQPILNRHALAFIALLVVYALSFRHVDFRLGAWAFMLASMALLGERRPLVLAILPVAVSLTVFVTFRYGFTVLVPTWI
ncbi:tripartite tricarboxylate transporter TctB family protein [Martelella mediterranea]|uniref:Tripartite tricarboxylate transporter TctB family protein n=1 Tax=Martelella mediterranea DSM 17316 TaxID=1122214 RepID=A0A1U9Z858_9HYPH|nr:tripartite tricarboxylate transporter TctB family protein [Martelella mediterranea]AQZ53868.1 Tripartite tricarboxylate transporter TctB family protein [Martelella mediterranea DSM 17316]